jgi:hypothetical protein
MEEGNWEHGEGELGKVHFMADFTHFSGFPGALRYGDRNMEKVTTMLKMMLRNWLQN